MTAPRPIAVAIVEDQRDIRQGLEALVGGTQGFRCSGAFRSMEDALARLHLDPPDVLLLDIGLPGQSGIEGTEAVKRRFSAVEILIITVYKDDRRIFNALCAGASGYLLKDTAPAQLLQHIADVAAGGAPMSPAIARRVVSLFRDFRPPDHAEYALSPQEQRILGLLVDGHNYRTAAKELGITVNTVSFHLKQIYEKLQVHSKSEAVAKALRHRLVR